MEIELIANYQCRCGEGPLWHPFEKRLYWTDIPAGKVFRYDPASGKHETVFDQPGSQVGGFTVQADGALLFFMDRGAVKVWRDGALETIIESLPGEEETRFNDVIADPAGRVFCGTLPSPERQGRLYRLELDGSTSVVLEDIGCANGMGFTPDRQQMYFTDSVTREIYLFDYDEDSGELSDQRLFAAVAQGHGVPDGMTVDANGDIWSARWDGWACHRYTPAGEEAEKIDFPAKKISSVVFGGEEYSDMYLSSAGGDDPEANGKDAGALFRVQGAGQGVAEFLSRIGL